MRRVMLLVLPVVLFVSACTGKGPTTPSSTEDPANSTAPTTGGATVSGAVQGVSSTSAIRSVAAAGGLTVSVAGTGISSGVDGQGRFTLRNVPGGTQQLQFTGTGVSGSVTVPDIQSGDSIELALSVQGGGIAVDSTRRSSGSEEQIEGRVESLPSAGSFVVAGRTVTTDANTQFFVHGGRGEIDDVIVGVRVHVKGTAAAGGVLASRVDVQNTNSDLPSPLNGVISGFTGSSSSFKFFIGTREIRGDSATEFFGNSAFTDLANGRRVEVKGQLRDGFVYAVRIHVNVDDDDDSTGGEISGAITAVGGTTLPTTIVVAGQTVTITAATEIRRRGDQYTTAVLQVGMTVDVSGTTSAGVFTARKVTITGSAYDVDVEGALVGPVTGTCPVISFKVGALALVTTSFTEFKKTSCGALVPAVPVKARGVMLAGGLTAEVARVEVK